MRSNVLCLLRGSRSAGALLALALAACSHDAEPPVARGAPVASVATAASVASVPPAVSVASVATASVAALPTAGARWRADAPLRAGMARIRSLTEALSHAEHGHLDRAQELAIADQMDDAVNTMFAQCRLAPAPDAALHPLLARLLAASQELRARRADAAMVDELRAIVAGYNELFEEPPA